MNYAHIFLYLYHIRLEQCSTNILYII